MSETYHAAELIQIAIDSLRWDLRVDTAMIVMAIYINSIGNWRK